MKMMTYPEQLAAAARAARIAELESEISRLEAAEVAVEHNEGTYSALEAARKIGTGDPAFANYTIYVRVGDGRRRVVGCDPEKAPGYARRAGYETLAEERRRLAELRRQLREADKS